jgi:hypothetical protein
MIRVEKRLPYGLMVEWGTVYKVFNYEDEVRVENEYIEYNKRQYVAMDMPVQFKDADQVKSGKVRNREKIATDFTAENQVDILETTDSYYDNEEEDFKCVVEVGDIVKLGNDWWNVREIEESDLFMPRKHTIYILKVQKVGRELINVKK